MKKKNKSYLDILLEQELIIEQKEKLKINTIENKYLEYLLKNNEVKTISDVMQLNNCAHYNAIFYLISEIQLIVLKYNLQEKYQVQLTEDDVLDYFEKQKISKLTMFRRLDINLPVEVKSKIYQCIGKIIKLENNSEHKALTTPKEVDLFGDLREYNFSKLANTYSCIMNLKHRRKLKSDGIESHINMELNSCNINKEDKLNNEPNENSNNPQKIRK